MERLSEKIIQYMIENNIFPEDDKEIYAFGLTQMVRAGTVKISRVFKLTKLFMVPMLPEVEPPATAYT